MVDPRRFPWPRCAVCNKTVDELRESAYNNFGRTLKLAAFCHGEREEIEVPMYIFRDYGWKDIRMGAAFTDASRSHLLSNGTGSP